MRILLFAFFFIQSLSSFAQTGIIDTSQLTNCWTHSFEENEPGWELLIYRPCSYKEFPLARFRFVMELREDGSCEWLYLAPNDAHHMKSGTWEYSKSNNELRIMDESGEVVQHFQIESLEKNMLVVKRL